MSPLIHVRFFVSYVVSIIVFPTASRRCPRQPISLKLSNLIVVVAVVVVV